MSSLLCNIMPWFDCLHYKLVFYDLALLHFTTKGTFRISFSVYLQKFNNGWFESFQRLLLSQFCIVEQCWREFARPFHIKWRYENVRSRGSQPRSLSSVFEFFRSSASSRPPALRPPPLWPPLREPLFSKVAQPQFQDWQVFWIMSDEIKLWLPSSEQKFWDLATTLTY